MPVANTVDVDLDVDVVTLVSRTVLRNNVLYTVVVDLLVVVNVLVRTTVSLYVPRPESVWKAVAVDLMPVVDLLVLNIVLVKNAVTYTVALEAVKNVVVVDLDVDVVMLVSNAVSRNTVTNAVVVDLLVAYADPKTVSKIVDVA